MRTESKVHAGIALGIAGVVAVGGQAIAANDGGGTPANKAIAAGSKLNVFGPSSATTLLTTTLRTSKPTDLMIQTSLECSILTKLTTGPDEQPAAPNPAGPPTSDSARAAASIRGWIEIDDDPKHDGSSDANERVVPIESSSQPPQDGSDPNSGTIIPQTGVDNAVEVPDDSATYCNRAYARTVTDRENPYDGIDQQTDYIDTKTANAFNWVLLNAGSGIHYVRLMGELVGGSEGTCPRDTTVSEQGNPGNGCTEAFVGHRTMIVEPTKMANDAVIAENGSY